MTINNYIDPKLIIDNSYGKTVSDDAAAPKKSAPDTLDVKDKTSISNSRDSKTSNKDREKEQKIQQEVQQLRATEEKVKAHEQAHKSAGGQFTGSVSYTYTTGPDGKRYISGGEVPIQIVQGKTPEETIRNMEIVRRAALAPADPSPQDRAVAAQANQIQMRARSEQTKSLTEDKKEEAPQGAGSQKGSAPEKTDNQATNRPSFSEGTTDNKGVNAKDIAPAANSLRGQNPNSAAIKAYRDISGFSNIPGVSMFA